MGIIDLRARVGTFTTPWNIPSNSLYKIPEFKIINDSLEDLLDERALEIYYSAKKTNKKIAIMWSGGIDSTSVLTAFLKNVPVADKNIITVVCDTNSILENIEFYKKFISNKLTCIHYRTINITEEFLQSYILLHGDPGDCLFGPSISKYQYFIDRGLHLEPWKNHLDKMKELLEIPHIDPASYEPGFGDWYVNKITNNLEETKQSTYLTSIAEWWFWTYYNFKWEFSCQRPFAYLRRDFTTKFSDNVIKEFAQNTFFNTEKFQQWAYSNIKKNIPKDFSLHKKEVKMYIYEFTKNLDYFLYKSKLPARPANLDLITSSPFQPIYYTKNWQGVLDDSLSIQTLKVLLERYQG
jgi:NH3-dependent NAD+ synthetase